MIHALGNSIKEESEMVEEKKVAVDETAEKKDERIIVRGKVSNCERLNVRTNPNISSAVRCIINKNAVVEIKENLSTDEWFRVKTKDNVCGFCMKKYITKLQ